MNKEKVKYIIENHINFGIGSVLIELDKAFYILVDIAKSYLKMLNPKFLDYQKIEKIIKAADVEVV